MRPLARLLNILSVTLIAGAACTVIDDTPSPSMDTNKQKIDFDILVTREGEVISKEKSGVMTRGAVDMGEKFATMDKEIPFGLVGIDYELGALIIDNAKVHSNGNMYGWYFDSYLWSSSDKLSFSAYYPYVDKVNYGEGLQTYSIPFTTKETEAGPLVSKTVEKAITQLNMVPLVFQHITNDIGFKICDATPNKDLQGLIHLRKLTATNVAQAGVFVNDLASNTGAWRRQAYYTRVVVFEGDALVGVGSENEKFVGYETLEDRMKDSHRYYSIPDDIEIGKQCVEVVYDVDGFKIDGYEYPPLKNQTAKYMLYGLLPGNTFVYGKQYTFHIGLDLSSVYRQITFAPSVSDWETKIYENNDDF